MQMTFMDDSAKPALQAKAKLSPNGRIVIPAAIREALGIQHGETLLMDVEDGVLRVESYRSRIRRIQEEFKQYAKPGILASDELIAERRREALLEQESFERARELRRIRDGYQSAESESKQDQPGTDRGPENQVA
jgi:AbrB family transcriptional regulator, stage V sporulation protein T